MNQIFKIVLTGGPCAGKTTALQKIEKEFTEKGYKVFIVGESATELIMGGARPFGTLPIYRKEFQKEIIRYQLYKEAMYERMAQTLPIGTKVLLVCDRGTLDSKAFIPHEEFQKVLNELSLHELDLLTAYQSVIHLVTAAVGAKKFYTLENNTARTETKEEAKILDAKTLACWFGHPHLSVITNHQSFENKMEEVIQVIHRDLGIPVPIQRQAKFTVDPNCIDKVLSAFPHAKKMRLQQSYLSGSEERCLRKMSDGQSATYYEIHKNDTEKIEERIKTMKRINEKEYEREIDRTKQSLVKNRYSFAYQNQYFRLDVFQNMELCLLEIEATEENSRITLPPEIVVFHEVSGDPAYRNYSLFEKINEKNHQKKISLSI